MAIFKHEAPKIFTESKAIEIVNDKIETLTRKLSFMDAEIIERKVVESGTGNIIVDRKLFAETQSMVRDIGRAKNSKDS